MKRSIPPQALNPPANPNSDWEAFNPPNTSAPQNTNDLENEDQISINGNTIVQNDSHEQNLHLLEANRLEGAGESSELITPHNEMLSQPTSPQSPKEDQDFELQFESTDGEQDDDVQNRHKRAQMLLKHQNEIEIKKAQYTEMMTSSINPFESIDRIPSISKNTLLKNKGGKGSERLGVYTNQSLSQRVRKQYDECNQEHNRIRTSDLRGAISLSSGFDPMSPHGQSNIVLTKMESDLNTTKLIKDMLKTIKQQQQQQQQQKLDQKIGEVDSGGDGVLKTNDGRNEEAQRLTSDASPVLSKAEKLKLLQERRISDRVNGIMQWRVLVRHLHSEVSLIQKLVFENHINKHKKLELEEADGLGQNGIVSEGSSGEKRDKIGQTGNVPVDGNSDGKNNQVQDGFGVEKMATTNNTKDDTNMNNQNENFSLLDHVNLLKNSDNDIDETEQAFTGPSNKRFRASTRIYHHDEEYEDVLL